MHLEWLPSITTSARQAVSADEKLRTPVRYTGTLKFFVPKRGYGYIKIDEGFQYDKEGVPEEIRVETAEMNAGGGRGSLASRRGQDEQVLCLAKVPQIPCSLTHVVKVHTHILPHLATF